MKCFHFTNGERRDDEEPGIVCRAASKVSWARSLSVASSSYDTTRRSEFDLDSRDLSDSVAFQELLSLRRANDLRVFKFSELKSASRGFSRALLIGEGGFGCVYRGIVKGSDDDATKMDVAIKQLNRNGFQACPFILFFFLFFILKFELLALLLSKKNLWICESFRFLFTRTIEVLLWIIILQSFMKQF